MNRKVLIAMVFMLAMLASIKTFAQTTDITVHFRVNVNSAPTELQDVKKFYFEGENVVFKLGNDTTTSFAMTDIKKMTLNYNENLNDIDGLSSSDAIFPNPVSDVLYFELEKGCWVCVRPSGTEPKLKAYLFARGTDRDSAEKALDHLERSVRSLCE